MIHISETSIDILDSLILLHVLAEWATTFLHVGKLVFILEEELAALVADGNCNIRHHVLEVLLWPLWTEHRVVYDENFLKPHALQYSLVHFYWLVLVW